MAVVLIACLALSACGGIAHVSAPPSRDSPSPSQTAASAAFCERPVPAALAATLRRGWTNQSQYLLPFDSTGNAEQGVFAAAVQSPAFSGVALVDAASGRIVRRIEPFPDPAANQAIGAYNGTWAIWKETQVQGNVDNWIMKAWNSKTGQVTVVGRSPRDAHGAAISSSWQGPLLANGVATWVQGVNDAGIGEVITLTLATGRRNTIHRGHVGWYATSGGSVVWAESPAPGALTRISAANLVTGHSTPPPAALATVTGAWGFVSDGPSWIWINGENPTAFAAFEGAKAQRIAVVPQGGASPPLAVADGLAVVPVSAGGAMLINLRTHAWTYDPTISSAEADGTDLLVNSTAGVGKGTANRARTTVLSPGQASSLTCG